jgi:hypothetical protein
MAKRQIAVRLGEEESRFAFSKIDRSKLYGARERVVLDEEGERCIAAYLTGDGAALVPPGGTAHLYVDDGFDTVDRKELVAVDDDGRPLEAVASTLGVPQELAPVTPERVLEHKIVSVYALDPDEEGGLGEALRASLADGDIFEGAYNYRDGYTSADAMFLLENDDGIFALVGEPTGFRMIRRDAEPEVDDDDDDDETDELDDDLDFSML